MAKETPSTMLARLPSTRRERSSTVSRASRCGTATRAPAASAGIGQRSGGLQQQALLQGEEMPAHRLLGGQGIAPLDGVEHLVVLGGVERDPLFSAQRLSYMAPGVVLPHPVDHVEQVEEEGVRRERRRDGKRG